MIQNVQPTSARTKLTPQSNPKKTVKKKNKKKNKQKKHKKKERETERKREQSYHITHLIVYVYVCMYVCIYVMPSLGQDRIRIGRSVCFVVSGRVVVPRVDSKQSKAKAVVAMRCRRKEGSY